MSHSQSEQRLRALFAAAIFVGSFLLFLVQPMIARALLPKFGGAASVWAVCMLFFQTALLAGYVFAHVLATRRSRTVQLVVFASAAALAVFSLRTSHLIGAAVNLNESPEWQILSLLVLSIGAPYAILSSVSPLLQSWTSSIEKSERFYRLYALSNLASLLALLAYPFGFERIWGTAAQLQIWSAGFFIEILLLLASGIFISKVPLVHVHESAHDDHWPALTTIAAWWTFSFLGCVALLAFTNFLTTDVAPVPLLWVLPLALYLVTFIVVFERERPIPREPLFLFTYGMMLGVTEKFITGVASNMVISGAYLLLTLFCCCLVCHGELARRRPDRKHLTAFYLILSLGGCSGGAFVGLIAPRIFRAYTEFPLALLGMLAVIAWQGVALLHRHFPRLRGIRAWSVSAALFAFGAFVVCRSQFLDRSHQIAGERNFFGVIRVVDLPGSDPALARRTMFHGRVNHGIQLSRPDLVDIPTAYYGIESGAWIATTFHKPEQPRKIGVIGLGAGVIAAHGHVGDRIEYYEINPLVEKFARQYFSFLSRSKAEVSVQIGDGRLLLERSAAKSLDILIVDAFSGDAIPSHLLTREAFVEYFRQLAPGGLLVLHISNSHLDLEPVVWSIARELGLHGAYFYQANRPQPYLSQSYYMILSREESFFTQPEVAARITRSAPKTPSSGAWTDDWIDLLSVIRWHGEEPAISNGREAPTKQ